MMKSFKRFRFSLLSFLVFFTLAGVSFGVWLGMAEPILRQWRSAGVLLDAGAMIETAPSSIPSWVKSLLPEGQCDNIVAVDFKRQNATDAAIKALENLPHLQRLYLQRTNLQPAHIDSIVGLPEIKTLSVWGNSALREDDIGKLAEIDSLELVDFHVNAANTIDRNPVLNWKVLLPFAERPDLRVKHDCVEPNISHRLDSGEVLPFFELKKKKHLEYFVDSNFWPKGIIMVDAHSRDIRDILKVMPNFTRADLTIRRLKDLTENLSPLLSVENEKLVVWRFHLPLEEPPKEGESPIEEMLRTLAANLNDSVESVTLCIQNQNLDLRIETFNKRLRFAWPEDRFDFEQLLSSLWAKQLFKTRKVKVRWMDQSHIELFRQQLDATQTKSAFPKLGEVMIGENRYPIEQLEFEENAE